uniref:Uncharacterized protein n=1 Tax=Ditylenchus dipsaci TaxID=166011 RepID=A0A915EIK7_9BILA
MKEFNSDLPSTSEADNAVQDPSSISLFSAGPEAAPDKTSNQSNLSSPSASNSNAPSQPNLDQSALLNSSDDNNIAASISSACTTNKKMLDTSKKDGDKSGKKQQSYTSYVAGKATEVAKRRNLNERIGRLQSKHGILFNVPQCETITLNQLAIFLRRLRKSTDVRALMSSELMLKIFQEDAEVQPKVTSTQSQAQNQHHPAVISVNEVLGSDDETRQRDDEDEDTEVSSDSDNDMDSERPTTSRATEHNSYDPCRFYKERMEILAADARALALHRRLSDTQQRVRQAYATLPQDFILELCRPLRMYQVKILQ